MLANTYHIFITVAECGNISAASHILCLTPSAVSHSISKLERELNINLFIRDKKGVKLTDDGRKVLEYARRIVDEEHHLLLEAANLANEGYGSVSIGAFCSVAQWWLPKIIKDFKKVNPDISIIVHQGSYQNIVDWLYSGKIDLGFLTEPLTKPFDFVPLHKERLMCVTPKAYKIANEDYPHHYVTLDEIVDWTLINQASVNNIDTAILLKKHNITLNSYYFMEDDQSILAMVEANLGFSIMPELVLKDVNKKVNIYPFEPCEYRTICLVKLKTTNTSFAIKKMKNHIINFVKDNNLMNV